MKETDKNGWIKIPEEGYDSDDCSLFPNEYTDVQMCDKWGDVWIGYFIYGGIYIKNYCCRTTTREDDVLNNITHWKPIKISLPECYE